MKCEYCNRRNDSQAQTCAGCGAPLGELGAAATSDSPWYIMGYTAAAETEYESDDMYLVPKEHHKRLIKSAMLAQINRNPKISIKAENNANAALFALRDEIRAKAKERLALAEALAGIIIGAVVIAILVIARLIY